MYQNYSQLNDDLIQKILDENKRTSSMLIHELRNPLSLIKGTLQYIEMTHHEVKEYKYWSQLFDLIMDMELLMSDASLLNSSSSLNIKATNIIDLIHSVMDNYTPQANSQQKLLTFKYASEHESVFSSFPCDADKIKQVLSNLLKNALEATLSGDSIEVILDINKADAESMLSIEINDNGQPIPDDELDTIFNPFVTHKVGGTGVGLALAKRITEAHLGSIQVLSTNELTGFTILLPLPKAI